MGKKGVPHWKWSKEEKLGMINRHLEDHVSLRQLETEEGVSKGLISTWRKRWKRAKTA